MKYIRLGVVIGIITVFSLISITILPDVLTAYGVIPLNKDDIANSIQVRIKPVGTEIVQSYNSFSRVGFVTGDNNFLLESIPSQDKRPFYAIVKDSIDKKDTPTDRFRIHVAIDIFSGNGQLIETLEYRGCQITEYFVHVVDSRGKIMFNDEQDSLEIREVTRFECTSYTINLLPTPTFSEPKPELVPNEGQLHFNTTTNTLQRYTDGKWVDISRPGGLNVP